MGYADPSLIRDVIIQVRLNDNEADLLDAVVKYTGQQKSTLMRELFLSSAMRVLSGDADIAPSRGASEAAYSMSAYSR